ncbi:MAG: DUF2059 domain-containing protein [Devosia sp.]|uniref:DUF2059 domain-containing protein n=1 Tax=Devosia sp. TaxID=1871048 RepID=UPI0024CD117E|nr:DUF2059 domain-containing protein [Devosia sp.]UYN99743.1 MAG: DUF2059 domain-containing protein [Devosia sp.]
MAFWKNTKLVRGAKLAIGAALAAGMIGMAAPAIAQEVAPEQLALARKYIDLTDRGAIFEVTVVETGIQTMRQIVLQDPELADVVTEVIGEVVKEYNGRKGELLDQFARVYAIRFTAEELQQIVTFYESPVGQKLAQSNQEMNADLQRVLQVYTNTLKSEFFAKVRTQLRSRGVEL